eukprot:TRINITY_DN741_c0_g1_i1.p1 TRINITY_DN741_c0_g1~~TRINITY_DN741_c0_g1_i1.p1  ORF type:complete len:668 (-),score=179.26 TRINITY_DN741_c0_g1_i1:329-2332(-)
MEPIQLFPDEYQFNHLFMQGDALAFNENILNADFADSSSAHEHSSDTSSPEDFTSWNSNANVFIKQETPTPPIEVMQTPPTMKKRRRDLNGSELLEGIAVKQEEDSTFDFALWKHQNIRHYRIFNQSRQDLTNGLQMAVKTDKNIGFSEEDQAHIHYKQNQFQITTDVTGLYPNRMFYLEIPERGGFILVDQFLVDIFSVKSKKENNVYVDDDVRVPLFQTGKTRTKNDTLPAVPNVLTDSGKSIHARLRFQASTLHNGRHSPQQQQEYFKIVVQLQAKALGTTWPIMSYASHPLIVRGQNPGRYASTKSRQQQPVSTPVTTFPAFPETSGWVKRENGDVVLAGKVGINTNSPQEALSVHGNALITGSIMKPSDMRIKENLEAVDTTKNLENIKNLKVYDYDLKKWKDGPSPARERGVLAQDVARLIPQAVKEFGDIQLENGTTVQNLMVVNERVLLFENIGATQELSKIIQDEIMQVDDLEERTQQLEDSETERLLGENHTRRGIGEIVDFITDDEITLDKDTGGCCYISMFGLGPAWTFFILGFFVPVMWIPGLFYTASTVNKTRRYGGLANLAACAVNAVILLLWFTVIRNYVHQAWAGTVFIFYSFIGVGFMVFLSIHLNKRANVRENRRRQLRARWVKPREIIRYRPTFYAFDTQKDAAKLV